MCSVIEHGQAEYRGKINYCECSGTQSKSLPQKILRAYLIELKCVLMCVSLSSHFGSYSWQLVNVVRCSSGPTIHNTASINYSYFFFSLSLFSRFNGFCLLNSSFDQLGIFFQLYEHKCNQKVYVHNVVWLFFFLVMHGMRIRTSLKSCP